MFFVLRKRHPLPLFTCDDLGYIRRFSFLRKFSSSHSLSPEERFGLPAHRPFSVYRYIVLKEKGHYRPDMMGEVL